MYEFKKDIKEIPFKLGDKEFILAIEPTKIMDEVNKAYNNILRAQEEISAKKSNEELTEAYEKFGECVLLLIRIVFKEHCTDYIEYYGGDYTGLFMNLIPFIEKVIFPILQESQEKQREILKEHYHKMKSIK